MDETIDNPDEDRAPADDFVAQRAYAFLELALNYDEVPEDARGELKAFLGALTRSIASDPPPISRLKKVQG
jgi:hypothetical protein